MSSKNVASTTIGTSMGQEICLILGQVPFKLLVVLGETDEKAADIQARSFMVRTLDDNGKQCQAEGEAKMVT